jgi:hypothetical protein
MTPTAATQAAPPATPPLPAEPPATRAPGPLRNGNHRGNPNLAPRCGAKARTTGCPCRAPAMPNGRCRMHGGKCRGPSTPEGRARMTAANTRHGNFSTQKRAGHRYVRTLIDRNRLLCAADLLRRYLPPDMAARLAEYPPELSPPIRPCNLPYLTPQDAIPCNVRTRRKASATPGAARRHIPAPPAARTAERHAAQAEAAAQAPWRQAIALARVIKRAIRKARAAWRQERTARRNAIPPTPSPLEGEGRGEGYRRNAIQRDNAASPRDLHAGPATPTPPFANYHLTPLQRELAARLAGLRGPRCGQPRNDAGLGPAQ